MRREWVDLKREGEGVKGCLGRLHPAWTFLCCESCSPIVISSSVLHLISCSESCVFRHTDKSNSNSFWVRSKFNKVRSIKIVGLAIAHASGEGKKRITQHYDVPTEDKLTSPHQLLILWVALSLSRLTTAMLMYFYFLGCQLLWNGTKCVFEYWWQCNKLCREILLSTTKTWLVAGYVKHASYVHWRTYCIQNL